MDIVYLCRGGENEELKYSLRSTVNMDYDLLHIFGDAPYWFRGKMTPTYQFANKHTTTTYSLMAACMADHVSDPFIMFNDDFFVVQPTEFVQYDRGSFSDFTSYYIGKHPYSKYTRGAVETLAFMQALGFENPVCYETHTPLLVHKAPMLETLEMVIESGITTPHKRSIYGNLIGLDSVDIGVDPKIYDDTQVMPDCEVISSVDDAFFRIKPMLEDLFPTKSKYEMQPTRKA